MAQARDLDRAAGELLVEAVGGEAALAKRARGVVLCDVAVDADGDVEVGARQDVRVAADLGEAQALAHAVEDDVDLGVALAQREAAGGVGARRRVGSLPGGLLVPVLVRDALDGDLHLEGGEALGVAHELADALAAHAGVELLGVHEVEGEVAEALRLVDLGLEVRTQRAAPVVAHEEGSTLFSAAQVMHVIPGDGALRARAGVDRVGLALAGALPVVDRVDLAGERAELDHERAVEEGRRDVRRADAGGRGVRGGEEVARDRGVGVGGEVVEGVLLVVEGGARRVVGRAGGDLGCGERLLAEEQGRLARGLERRETVLHRVVDLLGLSVELHHAQVAGHLHERRHGDERHDRENRDGPHHLHHREAPAAPIGVPAHAHPSSVSRG